MGFIDENFLLKTETAKKLFNMQRTSLFMISIVT